MSERHDEREAGEGAGRRGATRGGLAVETRAVDTEAGDGRRVRPTADAWTTAAVAHASILLTLLLGFAGGVGAFVGLVIPLILYLSYRERSRFVALHALQALIYQGVGILVYLALVTVLALAVTVAWAISGLLSVVVVGLLLIPLALMIALMMVLVLLTAPLAWVGYGLYAAYEVYQGKDFRYMWIGDWVEREVSA